MNHVDDLLAAARSGSITDVEVLVRELRVRVGVLSKPVTIRIYQSPQCFTFETSSFMKPGGHQAACDDEARPADSEAEALRRAVRTLTQGYEEAVRRGEMPDEAWLVETPPAR